MDTFHRRDLDDLIGSRRPNCVSIFLPTHAGSEQGQGDLIALRNLLDEAEAKLQERGVARNDAEWMLAPGRALLADKKFWHDRSAGLAVFMAVDYFRCWRLSRVVESWCSVGDRAYAKPLFALLDEAGRYYLLALSRNRARLFVGDPDQLGEVTLTTLPAGIEEVTDHAPPEGSRQVHTGQRAFAGKEGEVFHGQGGSHDHAKRHDLLLYLREVDHALRPVLHGQTAPLVFAGVEELLPHFRDVNSYPHLFSQAIHANPDRLTAAELRAHAAPLLQPYWRKRRHEDLARFDTGLGTSRVSANIEEILKSAQTGRIESIFVAGDLPLWGRWDETTEAASLSETCQPGDEDLLDVAAVSAYRRGGRVHVVPAKEVPGGLVVAALFRYADRREPSPSS